MGDVQGTTDRGQKPLEQTNHRRSPAVDKRLTNAGDRIALAIKPGCGSAGASTTIVL
jgi:hypothetical protein